MTLSKEKLSNIGIAIVTAHTMRRFILNFKPHERTNAMDIVITRLRKFLLKRERINLREFAFCTEFERVMYQNATDSYDKATPIFALDFVTRLYDYFEPQLKKHAFINPKLIEKIAMVMTRTDIDSKQSYELEKNSGDLLETYIKVFEPYSSVSVKKSLFQGKKLTIKNNMILEGKEIASGF
jgi:hypothetical protein